MSSLDPPIVTATPINIVAPQIFGLIPSLVAVHKTPEHKANQRIRRIIIAIVLLCWFD